MQRNKDPLTELASLVTKLAKEHSRERILHMRDESLKLDLTQEQRKINLAAWDAVVELQKGKKQ